MKKKETIMKKFFGIGAIVLVLASFGGLGIWSSVNGNSNSGFTEQHQKIQGLDDAKFASAQELNYLFQLTIPGTNGEATDQRPWKYVNNQGCTCFEWDTSLGLPKGVTSCQSGQYASPGMKISVACPAPNTVFYLQK